MYSCDGKAEFSVSFKYANMTYAQKTFFFKLLSLLKTDYLLYIFVETLTLIES